MEHVCSTRSAVRSSALSGAQFRLRLTVEFPHGQPPTVALVNGQPVALTVTDSSTTSPDVSGVATGESAATTLGFESPSLFVAVRTPHPGANLTAFTAPEDEVSVKTWLSAAAMSRHCSSAGLAPSRARSSPCSTCRIPTMPPGRSAPLLAISLRDAPPDQLSSVLAHALTHAWMNPSTSWLNEGTANFMGTVWTDKLQGRDKALSTLEAGRHALALAEPASPADGAGQPLTRAIAPVYYRTKAAYVLWMLRDLVGDDALSAALIEFNSAQTHGTASSTAGSSESASFQQALKKAAPRRDLKWLFADWIDADHGLPDLTIDKVFPNAVQSGNWLVSVTISNAGYAAAEVPVTVRSATNTTTDRVLVPARGSVTKRILVQGKPTEVQVNDGTVPETQASVHVTSLDQPAGPQPPPAAAEPPSPSPQ